MEKNKKLNNKGYMLVEIILASVIAFSLAYFMIEITIKLKNKNDDLLVETLTQTDNAIISNAIYKKLSEIDETQTPSCGKLDFNRDGNKVYLGETFIVEVNKYVSINKIKCEKKDGYIHAILSMKVHGKESGIDLYYKIS